MTYLQNFATLPEKLLESEGKWAKIQKILKGFFPVTGKGWIFSNIRRQDWTILQSEQLTGLVNIENVAVPKFRNLPDKYRLVNYSTSKKLIVKTLLEPNF